MPAAKPNQADAARAALAEAQLRLRLGLYARALALFSKGIRTVEQMPIPLYFRQRLYPKEPTKHAWGGKQLVQFKPIDVRATDRGLILLAADKDTVRAVEMIEEDGEWKIDWVHATAIEPKSRRRGDATEQVSTNDPQRLDCHRFRHGGGLHRASGRSPGGKIRKARATACDVHGKKPQQRF